MTAAARWPTLSEPVLVADTDARARAQSILTGPELGVCPPLTSAQAHDVLRWHAPARPALSLVDAAFDRVFGVRS